MGAHIKPPEVRPAGAYALAGSVTEDSGQKQGTHLALLNGTHRRLMHPCAGPLA